MRRTLVIGPGLDGANTDDPAHLIGKNQCVSSRDAVRFRGRLRQIKGWKYDGSVADVAANHGAVYRANFTLAGATRTITVTTSGAIYIHNAAGVGTLLKGAGTVYLPRAVYGDQLIFCGLDGQRSALLYGGVNVVSTDNVTLKTVANQAKLVYVAGTFFGATTVVGQYIALQTDNTVTDPGPPIYVRILERVTDGVTVEDVRASITNELQGPSIPQVFANAFPCVPVYEAGTITFNGAADTVTGVGTKWATGTWGSVSSTQVDDALLALPPNAKARCSGILTAGSDTTANVVNSHTDADIPYKILRRLPVKDVCAYRGSLAATGCDQHKNTVYISPQGWNPSLPPGYVPPVDPTIAFESDNPNDFMLFPIEVPSPNDGDHNVALLPSPAGLLVIKTDAVHKINGDYPSFSQEPVASGAGCMDIRSAQSLPTGRFWAGKNGIFREQGGVLDDITAYRRRSGGINKDWRSLADGFDQASGDYCTIGEGDGKVLVSLVTDAGATNACLEYDLTTEAWCPNITHHKARFFFSSKIAGEPEKLLWVGDANQGRVMDSVPALDGSGIAKNGDGTSPSLQWVSGTALGGMAGIEGEALVGDVNIHANVVDVASANPSLTPSLFHANGARQPAAGETKALTVINADAVDRVKRHESRANRSGRLLQLTLTGDTSGGTNDATTSIELDEIVLEMFDVAGAT